MFASVTKIATVVSLSLALFQSACAAPIRLPDADVQLIARDGSSDLVKRVGEEFWFRFEDPGVVTAGNNILPLAARAGAKNFDDQAYKFISTDAAKVTRAKISGRVPTIYVLPAGTRASLVKQAKDFEVERDAKRAANFVVKDNEPGDLGIQGITGTALADFRKSVIRTVAKKSSAKAGGKATFTTITKGKASSTASKGDQAVLAKFT